MLSEFDGVVYEIDEYPQDSLLVVLDIRFPEPTDDEANLLLHAVLLEKLGDLIFDVPRPKVSDGEFEVIAENLGIVHDVVELKIELLGGVESWAQILSV